MMGAAVVAVVVGVYQLGRARADGIPTAPTMYFGATLDEGGVAVSGTRDVTVRLYDAATAGTALCSPPAVSTVVAAGRMRVPLDASCTSAVQANPNVWAELSVNGVVVGGRSKLGAVPYAVEAQRANDLTTAATARVRGEVYRGAQLNPVYATTDWVDLPGARIAFSLPSPRDVDLVSSGQATSAGAPGGTYCGIRFVLDDVPVTGPTEPVRRFDVLESGLVVSWSALWSWPSMPAGAHVIRTQLRNGHFAASYGPPLILAASR